MPAAPFSPRDLIDRRLNGLATKLCEKCGLKSVSGYNGAEPEPSFDIIVKKFTQRRRRFIREVEMRGEAPTRSDWRRTFRTSEGSDEEGTKPIAKGRAVTRKGGNMEVRDPVHGTIELSSSEMKVINSVAYQRLRAIKQLGFAEFSFPGATHNRFLHSMGVCHLAALAFR